MRVVRAVTVMAAVAVIAAGCSSTSGGSSTEAAGSAGLSSMTPPALQHTSAAGTSSYLTPGSSSSGSSSSGLASSGPSESSPVESPSQPSASGSNANLLAAAHTALDEGPDGGTLTSIESEESDTEWEVKIVTDDGAKYKVTVSRDGASVLTGPKEEDESATDKAENRDHLAAATLTYADAVEVLTETITGGTVDELELDDTDAGTVVWEADVYDVDGTKHELEVDAATGDVTEAD